MSSQEVQFRCQDHPKNKLERFCTTCTKSACKDCKHFVSCYTAGHDTKSMLIAVNAFNKSVTEVIKSVNDTKQELETIFNSIISDDTEFKSHVEYLKQLIENNIEDVVRRVREKGEKLMMDLEIVCKQKEEAIEDQVKKLEPHQMQLQNLKEAVTQMTDKPENKSLVDNYKSDIKGFKQNINKMKDTFLSYGNNLTPHFTINTEIDGAISKGLGKITSVDKRYSVSEGDESITVAKGQPFVVTVENVEQCNTGPCTLSATLIKPLHEIIAIDKIEYTGSGKYRIKGRCNEEGEWKMEVINGVSSIKCSPVNITVLPTLVQTIDNIVSLKIDNRFKVTDAKLLKDGCILVSSVSNELLKFSHTGSFISTVKVPNVLAYKIHQMRNGHFMFSDAEKKNAVMCNDQFKVITKFGKGILEFPVGLAVNNETRVLYVADRDGHFVYQFNIDSGKLIGKVGSMDTLNAPHDVILTSEGHLLVPDWRANKVQNFRANGAFIKTFVDGGEEDGKVWKPKCIVMDKDENVIVVSDHKLQLFDKNGIFIKRIDTVNDNIDTPGGITVISYNPRRLAVANYGANNVKIFNY